MLASVTLQTTYVDGGGMGTGRGSEWEFGFGRSSDFQSQGSASLSCPSYWHWGLDRRSPLDIPFSWSAILTAVMVDFGSVAWIYYSSREIWWNEEILDRPVFFDIFFKKKKNYRPRQGFVPFYFSPKGTNIWETNNFCGLQHLFRNIHYPAVKRSGTSLREAGTER